MSDTGRRASAIAAIALSAGLTAATCATSPPASAKYPRRPPSCAIRIVHESTPGTAAWDDIGMAEIGCYIDDGPSTCLQRLRAEGCRMGGDIIYDVPKRPSRPTERALVYRGHVAHSRAPDRADGGAAAEEPADAASGPVVPLAPEPVDGGGAHDDIGAAPDSTNLTP